MRLFHNLILSILLIFGQLGGEPKFKKWIELETYKEKILKAVESGHPDFPKFLLAYLSIAFHIPYRYFECADWHKIVHAFYVVIPKSPKLSLPIVSPSPEKHKEESWEYDGRTWYLYSHLIAKNYGWSFEYISCLRVRDAIATIQEILVDEQLDREFHYGLSEAAYSYDSRSKTSKFNPLPRPHWMRDKVTPIKDIKRFKIPVGMMPVGNVKMDGIPDELKPKAIDLA